MLQRVAFQAAGVQVDGILHLPESETIGGVAVLGGRTSDIDSGSYLCEAFASAGVAALRFAYRTASDIPGNLADAAGAVRLLRAHPSIPQRVGVVGHSYGGAIAALAAGRDSRLRTAILIAPPARRDYFGSVRPMAELSRTRAKVLIVTAAADDVVDPDDGERYAALLRQAGVAHRLVSIDGADHQFSVPEHRSRLIAVVTEWAKEVLA